MNLEISNWKEFKLGGKNGIFQLLRGKNKAAYELEDGDDCLYIGAKKADNGVMRHVKRNDDVVSKGNCVVLIGNGEGSVGYSLYMPDDFIGTSDVTLGYNEHINSYTGLFLVTVLDRERPKYSYGRKWSARISNTVIKLPAVYDSNLDKFIPDWFYMEHYIKSLSYKPLSTKNKGVSIPALNTAGWEEFKVGSIIRIFNGKGITKDEIEENPGDFIAVQSGEDNNGIIGRIDKDYCISMGYTMIEAPCLTVARSGSAGYISYQPDGCVVGDSAKILVLKDKDKENAYVYLFLKTILMSNKYKYTYGRKVTEKKYLQEKIMLPIISKGVPDYNFMERYIKAQPFGEYIATNQ